MNTKGITLILIIALFASVAQGISEAAEYLYWIENYKSILRANPDGTNKKTLITGSYISHFTIDAGNDKIYWADTNEGKIRRVNLDGSGEVETLVEVSSPTGFALDLGNGKMYWTSRNNHRIQRSNLDGSNILTLIDSGLSYPFDIVLDVGNGKMYWTEHGSDKIRCANLDGTNVEDLVVGLNEPWTLLLDVANGKMYWTDTWHGRIQRANLGGTNVETLITGLNYPRGFALDVANGKMYWTNTDSNRIQRANLDGTDVEDIFTELSRPSDIALEIPLQVLPPTPPLPEDDVYIYWIENYKSIQRANPDGTNKETLITGSYISHFTIDAGNDKIYWADTNEGKIRRVNLDGSGEVETLVEVSSPTGFALDLGNGKMYWTSRNNHRIQRSNLDGSNILALIDSGLSYPFDIVLDVGNGKMYWTEHGSDKIRCANLDGTNVEDLVVGLNEPWTLLLDVANGKMYWTDTWHGRIQRANLGGTNVETLITGLNYPRGFALDVANGKMYWTNTDSNRIQRANLDGTDTQNLFTELSRPSDIALEIPLQVLPPTPPLPEDAVSIYWIENYKSIQRASPDGTNKETLITGNHITHFTIDAGNGKIYWADTNEGKIRRVNLDGSGKVETLVEVSSPTGFALDLGNGKMYWTSRNNHRIQRSNLDGSNILTLIDSGLSYPFDIVLDVGNGKMYWTEHGSDKIRCANLDGTNVEDLVVGLNEPWTLLLDVVNGKMYWTNTWYGRIQRADLGGSNVETLITGLNYPRGFALDVANGKMYWTNTDSNRIQRANLDGTDTQNLITDLNRPSDIALSGHEGSIGTASDLLVLSPEGRPYEDLTKQHGGDVRCVTYSPWGVVMASGGTDDTMRLWRTTNGQALSTYSQHGGGINSIAFTPNDTWIASGSDDGTVRLWKWNTDADTWVETEQFEIEGNPLNNNVLSVAFSHDSTMLACGTSANNVLLWDYNPDDDKWVYRMTLEGHEDNVNSVAFRPGSTILASASDDDTVWLWDARTGKALQIIVGHTDDINSVAFSRDGAWLLTGSDDDTVILWQARGNSWWYNRTVSSFYGNVNTVAFRPTGNAFAMGCDDGAVLLFDMDSGAILPLERHSAKVRSVAFSKDGAVLASGSSDGKVRQWIIPWFTSTYGLEIPENMVWQPAQSEAATYFFFGGRVSSLTGAPHGADIEYEECEIKLHIPDQALYFVLPVTTQAGRKIKAGQDIAIAIINVLGLIPNAAGTAASAVSSIIAVTEAYESTVKAFGDDLLINLPKSLLDKPDASMPFIVMTIPRMNSVSVTVKQVVKVNGGESQTVTANRVWDFSGGAFAPSIAQPSDLAHWSPFQLLSPEGQEVLLKLSELVNGPTLSALSNAEAWQVPEKTSLLANYPNPFNPETWIPYQLATPADVSISIYTADGKLIRTLNIGHQTVGIYQGKRRAAHWDGKNALGESVASGVYFYTLKAGNFSATRKMLIRK